MPDPVYSTPLTKLPKIFELHGREKKKIKNPQCKVCITSLEKLDSFPVYFMYTQ